jgi:AAA+ ATPase superfamily predicted ATPase
MTTGMPLYHSILSGIALGDGRTHSAFKKANITHEVGMKAVNELCEMGVIKVEKSKKEFTSWAEDYKISDKLLFNTPFMKFWFAFVSPLFKGIKDGDYKEVQTRFDNKKADFISFTFEQLSLELLKKTFQDDPIVESGSYWDKDVEIDIYAKTESGKTIVGTCRYTNTKVKKTLLTKLQQQCKTANIEADIYVIFAKNGFSSELKSLKNENLKLYALKNFKALVE